MSPGCLAVAAYVTVLLSSTVAARDAQDSSGPARAPVAQTAPPADPVPQMEQALAKSPDDPKVNVALALALKVAVMLAALAGIASLWLAVLADVGASLLVVALSLRLLSFEWVGRVRA